MSPSLFKLRHQNVQWQLEHFDNANVRHVLLYQTSTATCYCDTRNQTSLASVTREPKSER
jgi:hypothetical protein